MPKQKVTSSQQKLSKSEALTIRMSPKVKFGLELLARKQHRSLTSVAELALNRMLNDPKEGLWKGEGEAAINLLENVWDPIESDRFINLAFHYPALLTYEEELIWKIVRETPIFWRGKHDNEGHYQWKVEPDCINHQEVRKQWDTLQKVALGELAPNQLTVEEPEQFDLPPLDVEED